MSYILPVCLYSVAVRGTPIPTAVPLPAAPSVTHGKALNRHKSAHFLRDLRKEALLTCSNSGEECAAGTVVAESGNHPSSSKTLAAKPVGPTHIPELDPKLRISTSKVTYSLLSTWVILTRF